MTDFADLEITLTKADGGKYAVEMRFTLPDSDSDTRVGADAPITVAIDMPALQLLRDDAGQYGQALTSSLFADQKMSTGFALARASAQTSQAVLRISLQIGPGAPELNSVYWETLLDPADNKSRLFTNENTLFSRYLASTDWRPAMQRARGDLKAVAAVSNPSDLANYKLSPVNVPGELTRAHTALGATPVTELGAAAPCSLDALIATLRDGVDILYLAAHGTAGADGDPRIWLQNADGTAAITSADDIVTQIKELQNLPRLIVLASCQSAGKGAGDVLQALGPRLAQAGVPAVLAMQGNISMDSVDKLMPVFFSELYKDGQIDRAMALARGAVRDAGDFWMPVLFMRLKSGRIWYVPGVSDQGKEFDTWPSIVSNIQDGKCTPILGAGLYEPLIGSWQQMAAALSDQFNYPLAPFYRDSMPQVSQYIATNQDLNTLRMRMKTIIRVAWQQRYAANLPDALKSANAALLDLFAAGGASARATDPNEQHKILASLPLPVYITTNFDNMLAEALTEAGKAPEVVICAWRTDAPPFPSIYDPEREPGYLPSVKRPLVYHLFGHFSEPTSMVLTEDDYFDFLVGFTANRKRTPSIIPPAVLRALSDSALMVLGFRLDDWSFRAVFRTVILQQNNAHQGDYSHVGVQLVPDDSHNQDPTRARQYLQKYFGKAEINIFWGNSQEFLSALAVQWKAG